MIAGLDSSTPPTSAQLSTAKARGVKLWSGYLRTKPAGIAHWEKEDFDRVKAAGLSSIAYCSGHDNPVACKAKAAEWKVMLCLDVEDGIRGDGDWSSPGSTRRGRGVRPRVGLPSPQSRLLRAHPLRRQPECDLGERDDETGRARGLAVDRGRRAERVRDGRRPLLVRRLVRHRPHRALGLHRRVVQARSDRRDEPRWAARDVRRERGRTHPRARAVDARRRLVARVDRPRAAARRVPRQPRRGPHEKGSLAVVVRGKNGALFHRVQQGPAASSRRGSRWAATLASATRS